MKVGRCRFLAGPKEFGFEEFGQKRRSPVETGDLNDCLPYEKKVRVGCLAKGRVTFLSPFALQY
jgi:hypothetical protein